MSKSVVRRVGIIGLGKMGHPMARHLRKAGFD
jgi:3-hydroxyisobutyrate dehydrogenase-like beta-hydroxyacid dehydrogenase